MPSASSLAPSTLLLVRVGAARFHSFTLARIARHACSRQSGCSRLTPP